jgi:hypothetical protein
MAMDAHIRALGMAFVAGAALLLMDCGSGTGRDDRKVVREEQGRGVSVERNGVKALLWHVEPRMESSPFEDREGRGRRPAKGEDGYSFGLQLSANGKRVHSRATIDKRNVMLVRGNDTLASTTVLEEPVLFGGMRRWFLGFRVPSGFTADRDCKLVVRDGPVELGTIVIPLRELGIRLRRNGKHT